MKIGIFSYNKYSLYMNYGAALHSFAFQKALHKEGIENYIVDYKSKHVEDFDFENILLTNIKRKEVKTLRSFIASLLHVRSLRTKYHKFLNFYDTNCKMYSDNGKAFTYSGFLNGDYESFPFTTVVCESDVTWSPKTNNGFDRALFFDFRCFNGLNKVAYSPSISNTNLSKQQEIEFSTLLKNYDFLSSREDETAQYVQNLTKRECHWVLDPVLLLSSEDYLPYTKKLPYKDFIIVYNCMKNDKNLIKEAQKFADEKNLMLIEISDYNQNKIIYKHKVLTDLGIEEYLYLFSEASYIFTNGFHGACFSLVFNKEFFLFARDGVDIKIKSLLRLFDLNERFVDFNCSPSQGVKKIDYSKINEILSREKEKSIQFIKSSFK